MFQDVGPDGRDERSFIPTRPDPARPEDLADDERAILEGRDPEYVDDRSYEGDASSELDQMEEAASGNPADRSSTKPKRELTPEEIETRRQRREEKKKREAGMTLRERVRERAAKKQFDRIEFYEKVQDNTSVPYPIRMEAAKRLDEMSIDKTPTAQPQAPSRPTILIGRAATGTRAGGDTVMPETVEEYSESDALGVMQEEVAGG